MSASGLAARFSCCTTSRNVDSPRPLVERLRGSSGIAAQAGVILGLTSGATQSDPKTITCERAHGYHLRGAFEPIKVRYERPETGGFRIYALGESSASAESYELTLERKILSVVDGASGNGLTANALVREIKRHYGREPKWELVREELAVLVKAGKLRHEHVGTRNHYRLPGPPRAAEERKARERTVQLEEALGRAVRVIARDKFGVLQSALVQASGLTKAEFVKVIAPLVDQGMLRQEPHGSSITYQIVHGREDELAARFPDPQAACVVDLASKRPSTKPPTDYQAAFSRGAS